MGWEQMQYTVWLAVAGGALVLGLTVALWRLRANRGEQAGRIERIQRFSQRLAAARSEQELYDRAVTGSRDVLDCAAVELVRDDGTGLRTLAAVDDGSETTPLVDRRLSTDGGLERADACDGTMLAAPVGEDTEMRALAADADAFEETAPAVVELLASHVGTALDRVRAEAELREERDRMETLASVVSHDLRNPLTVARGRVDLAHNNTDEAAVAEDLEGARDAHDRMDELIGNVLLLAREGRQVDERERVPLESVASAAWTEPEADAELVVEGEGAAVEADETLFRELLERLFHNAVTYGGEGVTVRVGRLPTGFYVEDDGPGIPADEREEVFDPGYSTANRTGLGLSIVETIAEAHGWEVTLGESESGGARFEIG